MLGQVALQHEVSNIVVRANLQHLLQLGIRLDLATVLGVNKVVRLDVSGDAAGDLSARQLSATVDTQEVAHLVGDLRGLGKAIGRSASLGTLLLGLVNGLLHLVALLHNDLQLGLSLLNLRQDAD